MSNNDLHEKDYLDSLNHEPAEPLIKVSRLMEILNEVESKYPHALWRNGVFGLIRSAIEREAK